MANLREMSRRRRQLRIQSDYLRIQFSASCIHLKPAAHWIEQGYRLARALALARKNGASSALRLLAKT